MQSDKLISSRQVLEMINEAQLEAAAQIMSQLLDNGNNDERLLAELRAMKRASTRLFGLIQGYIHDSAAA